MNRKLRLLPLLVALAVYCSYSYSNPNYIYESSGNAAQDGLNWVMSNVLPAYTGLQVNGVVYQYTTIKDPETGMIVTVQNEDAQNPGQYIFREQDDWSGLPGNTIRRAHPQSYIDTNRWGNGSIEIDGEGQVVDASVIYTYRYDEECATDPQSKPSCPGFVLPEIVIPDPVDPLDDDILQNEIDRERVAQADEDEEEQDRKKTKDKKDKKREMIEVLLGTTNTTELAGASQVLHEELLALDVVPPAYLFTLPTTVYEETVALQDSELPDNPKARRDNFAQQLLHEKLVDLQYQLGESK
jgi:hypothetical protein